MRIWSRAAASRTAASRSRFARSCPSQSDTSPRGRASLWRRSGRSQRFVCALPDVPAREPISRSILGPMCGIGGAVDLRAERLRAARSTVAVMNDLLAHRGPDGEGAWVHEREHVAFAHRRLTIIDLDTGDQPMADERGNWITYNGEIYNYVELRRELGEDRFRTRSDTEVILEAYRSWGAGALTRLRGMFAFALWDEQAGELFCARDRFGIKPFYYAVVGGTLYFASEIKALLPFLPSVE